MNKNKNRREIVYLRHFSSSRRFITVVIVSHSCFWNRISGYTNFSFWFCSSWTIRTICCCCYITRWLSCNHFSGICGCNHCGQCLKEKEKFNYKKRWVHILEIIVQSMVMKIDIICWYWNQIKTFRKALHLLSIDLLIIIFVQKPCNLITLHTISTSFSYKRAKNIWTKSWKCIVFMNWMLHVIHTSSPHQYAVVFSMHIINSEWNVICVMYCITIYNVKEQCFIVRVATCNFRHCKRLKIKKKHRILK